MQAIRTSLVYIMALSIVAGQLWCGCLGDSAQAAIADTSLHVAAVDEPAPCHGAIGEQTASDLGSDGDHDCQHCQTASAMEAMVDAPATILIGERDAPDVSLIVDDVVNPVAQARLVSDTGPPTRQRGPTFKETLVSQHILLLI